MSVLVLAALIGATNLLARETKQVSAVEVARQLDWLKGTIATEATEMLKTNAVKGSYTTVWRQFEDAAIEALGKNLPRHVPELTTTNFDRGKSGRKINRLADLAIVCGTNVIEISIKAARASANPENDMGTFRDHPNRKKLFAASFTLWVRYEDVRGQIKEYLDDLSDSDQRLLYERLKARFEGIASP